MPVWCKRGGGQKNKRRTGRRLETAVVVTRLAVQRFLERRGRPPPASKKKERFFYPYPCVEGTRLSYRFWMSSQIFSSVVLSKKRAFSMFGIKWSNSPIPAVTVSNVRAMSC